jgi:hypothetical protein
MQQAESQCHWICSMPTSAVSSMHTASPRRKPVNLLREILSLMSKSFWIALRLNLANIAHLKITMPVGSALVQRVSVVSCPGVLLNSKQSKKQHVAKIAAVICRQRFWHCVGSEVTMHLVHGNESRLNWTNATAFLHV